MTLTDTSIWVDYFRGEQRVARLADLLERDEVLLHPWILGELMLGALGPKRTDVAEALAFLPRAPKVEDEEVLDLISSRRLTEKGIGWVDAQLLASALIARCSFWTLDKRLATVARELLVPTLG